MSVLCLIKCKNTVNDTKKCIFASEIALNLYFYTGTAFLHQGVKRQIVVKWRDEVKKSIKF